MKNDRGSFVSAHFFIPIVNDVLLYRIVESCSGIWAAAAPMLWAMRINPIIIACIHTTPTHYYYDHAHLILDLPKYSIRKKRISIENISNMPSKNHALSVVSSMVEQLQYFNFQVFQVHCSVLLLSTHDTSTFCISESLRGSVKTPLFFRRIF